MTDSHQRLSERQNLQASFENGRSVLMLAPRRVGKTWLMDRMKEDMEKQGWLCIRLDVEGLRNEEEFLRHLCQEIEKSQDLKSRAFAHLKQRFSQLAGNAEDGNLAHALGKIDRRQFLETLVDALNNEKRKTLILIDEIALFVLELLQADVDGARLLLYHLRKLQQSFKNVMWFMTGSVGLDEVGRRHGISGALLGYDVFPLEPFTSGAAHSFIEDLFQRKIVTPPFDFADGAFEYLIRELGWLSPYHIEQIVKLIEPGRSSGGIANVATIQDIESALDKILRPTYRLHFASWHEHISKNFPADASLMLGILKIGCEVHDGEIETTYLTRLLPEFPNLTSRKLKDSLNPLVSDAYLIAENGRWRFRSGLLRRYWLEYVA